MEQDNGKEHTLPSGAILKIYPAPFADAKALYQELLAELQKAKIESTDELHNLMKDVLFIGFSSKKIDAAVEKCLARCTYNDKRITAEVWEPTEARQDYIKALSLVTWANVEPFSKGLYAEFTVFNSAFKTLNPR